MPIKSIVEDGYYVALDPDGNTISRGSKKDKRYTDIIEHAAVHEASGEYRIIQPEVKVSVLIGITDEPQPPNKAPEWVSTPSPAWVEGVGGTYALDDDTFDQEGDPLTYSMNVGSASLPTGVSLSGAQLVATTAVAEGTTTGIIIDVKDATSSLIASSSFSIVINPAVADPDFIISTAWSYSSNGYWDGSAGEQNVQPGDIIQLAAGNREPLRIRNIQGTLANPVIIRSDPAGKTTIRRTSATSGNFLWWMVDSEHFIIDGSYTNGETYGIVFTTTEINDKPTSGLQMWGECQDYTLRYIEVDGQWTNYPSWDKGIGIGIQHNDENVTQVEQPFRENILVEHCYVHDVFGEGIYLGPNSSDSVPLRNIEVRYNDIRRCGRDAFNIKSTIEGTNEIHHNYVIDTGLWTNEFQGGQKGGIGYFEGSGVIYNNWIVNAGEHGVFCHSGTRPDTYDPLPAFKAYNNVVINSGAATDTQAQDGRGISVSRPSGAIAEPASVEIYNNTIIDSELYGVFIDSSINANCTTQNNIISDSGTSAIADWSNGTSITTPNETGSEASQNFGTSYALTTSSPAKNAATTGLVASDDNEGMRAFVVAGADPQDSIEDYVSQDETRPLGADECRGALEYDE